MPPPSDEQVHMPSPIVRASVYALLVAMLACGFGDVEAWPLSAFRLFSVARTERMTSWVAQVVDEQGREHPLYSIARAQGNRGISIEMTKFHVMSRRGKQRTCQGWAEQSRRAGLHVDEIRIYQRSRLLSRRDGLRAAPPTSVERFVCRDGRVIRS